MFNSEKGFSNNSYVNFYCNTYFRLVGASRLHCNNSVWQGPPPKCLLDENICTDKPVNRTDSSYLISLQRAEFDVEITYIKKERRVVYLNGGYTCLPNHRFSAKSRPTDYKRIYKSNLRTYVDILYQNSTCIGPNRWQSTPTCTRVG